MRNGRALRSIGTERENRMTNGGSTLNSNTLLLIRRTRLKPYAASQSRFPFQNYSDKSLRRRTSARVRACACTRLRPMLGAAYTQCPHADLLRANYDDL